MWAPRTHTANPELLATTGDYLRIWNYLGDEQKVELKGLLNNNRHTGMKFTFKIIMIILTII